MLYTFNSFDSASKTVFTDTLKVETENPGPYVIAYLLAEHLRSIALNVTPDAFYRIVAAWQVLDVTVVILQDELGIVLTVQIYP